MRKIGYILMMFSSMTWGDDVRLMFSAFGQPLEEANTKADVVAQYWYSVVLDNNALLINQIKKVRTSDWLIANTSLSSSMPDANKTPLKSYGIALNQPINSLFAFRVESDGGSPVHFNSGRYVSMIPTGQKLQEGWRSQVTLKNKTWSILVAHKKRPDGVLLAGSISLWANRDDGESVELVPPAAGMAFNRQEILWLGDINQDAKPDLILKRTWVTGEFDYVFVIGSTWGTIYYDSDYPYQYSSSGAEDSLEKLQHISQKIPFPSQLFGKSAFSISEPMWNKLFSDDVMSPRLIVDRVIKLNNETMRFTFERLPRYQSEQNQRSSSSDAVVWDGAVLVRVYFRGKMQVLMQASMLDGAPFRVQVDYINDEPAIQISYSPHYNNSLQRYWIWSPLPNGQFVRLATYLSQGC